MLGRTTRRNTTWRRCLALALPLALASACGEDGTSLVADGGGAIATGAWPDAGGVDAGHAAAPAAAGGPGGGTGAGPVTLIPDAATSAASTGGIAGGGTGVDAGAAPPAGGGGVPTPTFLDGPVDGDPSAPVVTIPEVACGGPPGGLDGLVGANFGGFPVPGTANLQIGGRDVILSYPCDKHEGAQVTFILNLHGTMPTEDLKFYQHSYFAVHKLVTSHNLIVATPKSVVSQWGNGDNGQDLPHLYDVINWVYEHFSKFQITSLWVGGHSWGAMFAKNFVCDEMLRDRVRGVIGMSGGATPVGGGGLGGLGGATGGSSDCTDRISQIHTVGDQETGGTGGLPDQTAAATKHGCGAKVGPMDIGNNQLLDDWPNCSPGWTHFDFTMGAHEHTTPINPEVVQFIVERIKATEKKP